MFDFRIYEFIIMTFASLGSLSNGFIKHVCFVVVGIMGFIVLINLIKTQDDQDKKLK